MADKLKPATAAWHTRQSRWHHNSFSGHCAMMRANTWSIMNSTTATDDAKRIAQQINNLTYSLAMALKTRKEGK